MEVGDEAVAGKIALGCSADACHSPSRSSLHPFLSCCLPQRLAYMDCSQGFPCLMTSSCVQPVGSPSQRLEEGRREKLGDLLPQLPTSPAPGVYHGLVVSLNGGCWSYQVVSPTALPEGSSGLPSPCTFPLFLPSVFG